MNKVVAEKWVEALRSGKYKQGRGYLGDLSGEDASFCCLGVLCELAVAEGVITRSCDGKRLAYDDNITSLPKSAVAWAGMRNCVGYVERSDMGMTALGNGFDLITLNDDGSSFDEIASMIEQHVDFL